MISPSPFCKVGVRVKVHDWLELKMRCSCISRGRQAWRKVRAKLPRRGLVKVYLVIFFNLVSTVCSLICFYTQPVLIGSNWLK